MIPFFHNLESGHEEVGGILDELEEYFHDMKWKKTLTRPKVSGFSHYSSNVKRGIACESMVFGMTRRFGQKIQPSKNNEEYPYLYSLLLRLREFIPDSDHFDGITINKNLQCLPHKDGNDPEYNACIIGLGDYTGGNLGVRVGKKVMEYNIYRRFLRFNGNLQEHWTQPFSGDRYSIVYYKKKPYIVDH